MNWNEFREREKNPPENPLTERLELYERNEIILPNINFGNGGDDKQRQLYQIKSALPPALPNVFIYFFSSLLLPNFLGMPDIACIYKHSHGIALHFQ